MEFLNFEECERRIVQARKVEARVTGEEKEVGAFSSCTTPQRIRGRSGFNRQDSFKFQSFIIP
jgi:hypothetical protein